MEAHIPRWVGRGDILPSRCGSQPEQGSSSWSSHFLAISGCEAAPSTVPKRRDLPPGRHVRQTSSGQVRALALMSAGPA